MPSLSLGFDQIALLAGGTFSWLWVRLFVRLCHLRCADWNPPTVSIWAIFSCLPCNRHIALGLCVSMLHEKLYSFHFAFKYIRHVNTYIYVLASCNAWILNVVECLCIWLDWWWWRRWWSHWPVPTQKGEFGWDPYGLCRSAFEMLEICFPIPMYHTLHFLSVNRSVIPACLSEISFAFGFL